MITAIIAFLNAFPTAVSLFEQYLSVRKAEAQLAWAQALQAGLQPLEQGTATTDEQKAAAVKAVADAWAKMP